MSAQQFDRKTYRVLAFVSTTLRILLGPAIFLFPTSATLWTFLTDWADGEFFKRAGFTKSRYQTIDKILDYYWYVFILLFILFNPVPQKTLFYFLFGVRTIGQLIYFINRKEEALFFFPNVFEILFYVYVLSLVVPRMNEYLYLPKLLSTLAIIIPVVLVREYILHIRKSNLSWFFTGVKTYWEDSEEETN